MKRIPYLLLLFVVSFSFYGCEKGGEEQSFTQRVNQWILEDMNIYYRWEDKMPATNPDNEPDPKAYFNKLLYTAEDRWSLITDDAAALLNSLEGIESTFGYSLVFGRFDNEDYVFAVVEFVYPNTPASRAGIERGDIILGIDGAHLTLDNYTDVVYKSSGTLMMGVYDSESNAIRQGDAIPLTAEKINLDPAVIKKVMEINGKKIGYLFYAQYLHEDDTYAAFQEFKAAGVTDLVLDLRYNPGGAVLAAIQLCSILAPEAAVENESTLITMQWNSTLQAYWQNNNPANLRYTFRPAPLNMGLDKIYVLTGSGTASASELTITGLDPYLTVVTIGGTTHGKYAASAPLQKYIYKNDEQVVDPEFQNWVMMPIIYTYANSRGVTDFKNGLEPVFPVEEDIIRNPVPLGDATEPLLARAIYEITGVAPAPTPQKAVLRSAMPDYTIIARRFSKFDSFKNTLYEAGFRNEPSNR